MKDAKFGRQVTTESDVSTHLATDYGFTPQISPESMNSVPMVVVKRDVPINAMVEGLVCADTSMDLYSTNEVSKGTEFKINATDMYQGLVCGDSSMEMHSDSPSTPSQPLPAEEMFAGLCCSDSSLDLHLTDGDTSVAADTQYSSKLSVTKESNMYWGLVCGETSMDMHLDHWGRAIGACAPGQTMRALPTEEMFEGLVCADTGMDLFSGDDNGNIETGSLHAAEADVYWGLVCGDSSLDVHFDKDQLLNLNHPKLPTAAMFEGLVCADTTMDLYSTPRFVRIELAAQRASTPTPTDFECPQSAQVIFA